MKTMLMFPILLMFLAPVNAQTIGIANSIMQMLPVESGVWTGTYHGIVYWNTADGSHRIYSTRDGLPSDECNSIAQAPDGSIWAIVGNRHVVRHDGVSWDIVSDDSPLSDDYMYELLFDHDGIPWVRTNYGVYRKTGDTWHLYTQADGLAGYPSGMFIAPNGDIWLTHLTWCIDNCPTSGHGVSHFDGEKWEIFDTHNGLLDNRTIGVRFSGDGRVWVLSIAGFSVYDGATWVSDDTFGFGQPDEFACLSDGTVYVAKSAGIYRLKQGKWSMYTRDDIFVTGEVNTLFADSSDRLWVGSWYGVSMFDGSDWVIRASERTWSAHSFGIITQDSDGKILIGSSNGLYSWNGDTFDIYHTCGPAGMPYSYDEIALSTATGDIWCISSIISHFDGMNWNNITWADGLPLTGLYCIDVDNAGNVWIGTNIGLLMYDGNSWRTYSTDDGLKDNWITAVGARAPDDVWIGYERTGAAHFDGISWTTYEPTDELPMNYLLSVEFDGYGDAWIAANIGIFHLHNDSWTVWTPEDGLPDSWVDMIAVGESGQAWASIDWRLAFLDGDRWEFYETSPGNNIGGIFNQITALAIAGDGTLWCSTEDGIIHRINGEDYDTLDMETLTGITGLTARIIEPERERIFATGHSQVVVYSWSTDVKVRDFRTVPAQAVLCPNIPNPFNPATLIPFTLGENCHVTLTVFDVAGRFVAEVLDGYLP